MDKAAEIWTVPGLGPVSLDCRNTLPIGNWTFGKVIHMLKNLCNLKSKEINRRDGNGLQKQADKQNYNK